MIVKAIQGKQSSILWADYSNKYSRLTDKNEELFQLIITAIRDGNGPMIQCGCSCLDSLVTTHLSIPVLYLASEILQICIIRITRMGYQCYDVITEMENTVNIGQGIYSR